MSEFWRVWRRQWCPPQRLAEWRLRELQSLIAHAYERVPFYRERWTQLGVHPSDITSEADLAKLPLLSKAELRSRPLSDFLAAGTDIRQGSCQTTSGSTGRPLSIYLSPSEQRLSNLVTSRTHLVAGARPWRRRAVLQAVDRLPQRRDRLRRPLRLDLPSALDPKDYLQTLLEFRPAEVHGYNQSLRQLAQLVLDRGVHDLRLRSVVGTAELVTPRDRALINEAFGVPMFDHYASVEARSMGWECPRHTGYHLNSDVAVFEFINGGQPAKPGESGGIVVTPLHRRSMPLIRYEMGDVATLSAQACPCGRTLPLMVGLQGRRDDCIILASGRRVPPLGGFATVIEESPDVREYLVMQEALDLVVVQLVLRPPQSASTLSRVQHAFRELLHDEAVVQVVCVDSIQREGRPKLRRFASKLQSAGKAGDHV